MTDVVRIVPGDEPTGGGLVPDPGAVPVTGDPETPAGRIQKRPLYPRLLQLHHVHPNAWQRAVLGEGMALVGLLLALADLASAWSVVVLPLAVALVVKAHDVLAGQLARGADRG